MTPQTQERICNDSAQYLKKLIADNRNPLCYAITDYIAGATAENERAQLLVDALETILKQHDYYSVIELAANALEQWKTGKGKEDKVYRPCPHCGKELSRDRNLCCRACGKEVGDEG